jgi:16S rRNA G1207 methylase RsmC
LGISETFISDDGVFSKDGVDQGTIMKLYKVKSLADLTEKQFANINAHWDDIKKVK